ncbi:YcjF family protein [Oceanicella sp. SM1341]|uniref:YcjF family protein n=1 Tax=Oceanicella sp. SM1341 TaxID=1548889 RepID=UPI000E547CEC|nr:TIGR01620 family protein [Oceanicella sp. SM1341]
MTSEQNPPRRRGPVVFSPSGETPRAPETPPARDAAAEAERRAPLRRGAVLLDEGAALAAEAPSPAEAPPIADDDPATGAAMARATRLASRRMSWFGKLVWAAVTGLVGMAVSWAAWSFVLGLAERNPWLGLAALVLGGIVALGVLVFVVRELAGLARLSRVDRLRARADAARRLPEREAALAVTSGVAALYSGRSDLSWARSRVKEREAEILDPDALLALTEREYLGPLDAAAAREVELAARQVAVATALIPLAFADVLTALSSNVRMVRRIAEIYGGRAGTLGSWRLVRAVAAHLVATGAVAMGDDMIGAMLGGGVMSKLSRRFGEGVVNGALTARVGVAAMDVCRPMPFAALEKPAVTGLVRRALTGFAAKG